jgi:hypothetical protein
MELEGLMLVRAVFMCVAIATPGIVSAQDAPAAQHDGYAWAEACKDCHQDIYEAWEKTKHARALDRLAGSEKQSDCVGCHLAAGDKPVVVGSKTVNAHVQCETCHGPAKAHVEAARAGRTGPSGLTRIPEAPACERCHNAKSPKFKGFFYRVMLPLCHKVPAKG